MTAALDHSSATSAHPALAVATTTGFKPRLMPVPDSEPPLCPLADDDEQLDAAFNGAAWRRGLAKTRRRSSSAFGQGPIVAAPPMAHRRWAPSVPIEILRTRAPRAATRANAPASHDVYSAVGIVPAAGHIEHSSDSRNLPPGAMPRPQVRTGITPPSATAAGTVLVRATLEALSGRRAIEQLQPHFTPGVFSGLGEFPMLGRRTQLVSIWVCEPSAGTAEVSAAFRCGPRTRALAMQLRHADGQWHVTALQVG